MKQHLNTKKLHYVYEKGTEEEQEELRNSNNAYLKGYITNIAYGKVQDRLYKLIKKREKEENR